MMIRERTALDPIVWAAGSLPEKRKVDRAGRYCTWLPGPVNIFNGGWHGWPDSSVTQHDVASWPKSVCSFVKVLSLKKSSLAN